MEILAEQINRALELRAGTAIQHCGVSDEELQRIWPLNEVDRERKIAHFAEEHGLMLTWYNEGTCAIFEKKLAE